MLWKYTAKQLFIFCGEDVNPLFSYKTHVATGPSYSHNLIFTSRGTHAKIQIVLQYYLDP